MSEPVAGAFRDTILETAFVTALHGITGVAAILSPFAERRPAVARATAVLAILAGMGWTPITLESYIGHLALAS